MKREENTKAPCGASSQSEEIVGGRCFVHPNTGIALGAIAFASFQLYAASVASALLRSALLVGPDSHIKRIVTAIIGTGLPQCIKHFRREVDGCGDGRAACHGVAP